MWEGGEVADKVVDVQTLVADSADVVTFRLKLSVQTTGDYAGCVTPELASGGKMISRILPAEKGTLVFTAPDPMSVRAGDPLRVTVSRVGGSFGRVVVKAKTQGYPGVSNLSAVLNEDLTYVKEYLEWKDGETGDQVVDVPTALVDGVTYPRTFRLKFTAQTTGDYAGCAAPEIPDPKVTVSLYR